MVGNVLTNSATNSFSEKNLLCGVSLGILFYAVVAYVPAAFVCNPVYFF
jgi:hypothetical protein